MQAEIDPDEFAVAVAVAEHGAAADSVVLVHDVRAGNDAAYAVSFVGRDGRARRAFLGLVREASGTWLPTGGFCDIVREPAAGAVFSNFGEWGAGGSKKHSVLGGWVTDRAAASARIVDPQHGVLVEADVRNEVVVFMSEGELALRYARVELLDSAGQVLRTQAATGH